MSPLQQTVARLADELAHAVLELIASQPLSEIAALAAPSQADAPPSTPSRPSRPVERHKYVPRIPATSPLGGWKAVPPPRPGAEDIESVLARLVTTLKAGGVMTGAQLQRVVRVNNQQLARALALALERGLVTRQGDKQAAHYAAR